MPATIVIGAQWGDEGKGLISAYLAAKKDASLVCKAGTGCNAEHGIFLKNNETYLKVNQLPLGWIMNSYSKIRIGSGVAVNPDMLFNEMRLYGVKDRVKIDFRCPIITKEHIEAEKNSKKMSSIGSTFSGTGFCRADFILRTAKQAKDIPELEPYLTDLGEEINIVSYHSDVIIESSQGTLLSLAVSPDYPNVTSDNVTTCAVADDVLLNWKRIKNVILVVKALPTREGAGVFGSIPELAEGFVKQQGMFEASSIGGVQRRKASGIDFELLDYAVEVNGATEIALTFCEHYDPDIKNMRAIKDITKPVWELIDKIQDRVGRRVSILNTGKSYRSIIDLEISYPTDVALWDKIDNSISKTLTKMTT